MYPLIDMHSHLLPYVDDGVQTLQEAKTLLQMQCAQGVGTVCLTPHLRSGMFETSQQKINEQYARLCECAAALPSAPALRLGREYHCDNGFFKRLAAGRILPLEGTNTLLIEFSSHHHNAHDICAAVQAVQDTGFIPLIAHVERYGAVRNDPAILSELHAMGAYCQMNAEGVLGKMGLREKWFCTKLLKSYAAEISVIASDAHRVTGRVPNLGDAAAALQKKLPPAQWQALFVENPKMLLGDMVYNNRRQSNGETVHSIP